jgi:hypothetical protein
VVSEEIILLDGTSWDKSTLIEAMRDDDFYYGYLGKAAMSSSNLKKINDSPKEYERYVKFGEDGDTTALVMGNLIHTLLLEPHLQERFEPVECASKAANIWKDAVAHHEGTGKKLLLRKDFDNCYYVADALKKNSIVKDALCDAEYELPAISMLYGIPFRGKADIKKKDSPVIYDLKTTSNLSDFRSSAFKYSYAAQAYIYCTLFDVQFENFKFIVIDKGNKDVGIFSMSEEFFERGRKLVERGVDTYIKYFVNGEDLENYVVYGEL